MGKHLNKIPGAKEQYGELDYLALDENMGDEAATSWLFSKIGEEGCLEIKQRIEKALIDNIE